MSVVIRGNVTVKVTGLIKQKQLPGGWGVLYDGGGKENRPPCLELFEEKNASTPVCSICLEHLKFSDKSFRQTETHLVLSIKKEKHFLYFDTLEDKEDWVQSFCHISPDLWKQRKSSHESSTTDEDVFEGMSDNVLYDSCDKVQHFKVSMNPTKASETNNLQGHFLLYPSKDSIQLMDITTTKVLHEWPYRQIRKYGRTRKLFRMEVGRRCSTGEGEFEFFTPDGPLLTELVTRYTNQMRDGRDSRHGQDSAFPVETSCAEAFTPSPQHSPLPTAYRDLAERTAESSLHERGSTTSVGSRGEAPRPAPRHHSQRQENGSSDTKIYGTSTGLTAPLDSKLKHELDSKLHQHASDGTYSIVDEENIPSFSRQSSKDEKGSSENIKDKKKSDKERKKLEKERKAEKKKQEKVLKEQREREAKELKELEKRTKKENKGHTKLQGRSSLDQPKASPPPVPEGHIYDEPGELIQQQRGASSSTLEPTYTDVDVKTPAGAPSDVYALPVKPKKDSWKKYGMTDSELVHEENYDRIKQCSLGGQKASASQASFPTPSPLPQANKVDDTYNHLGDLNAQSASAASPNVYGMASAVITVDSENPAPASAASNEYEVTDIERLAANRNKAVREQVSEYEEAFASKV